MLLKKTALIILLFSSIYSFAQQLEDTKIYEASHKISNSFSADNGNEFINVQYYNIDNFQIIPNKKLIRAKIKIGIVPSKNLKSFYLDFHNSYKVISVKVNDTLAVSRFKHGNNLLIIPENYLKKNKLFEVEINYYNTKEIKELWDQTIFKDDFLFGDLSSSLLYPCNDIVRDRARYNLNLIIPKSYNIIAFNTVTKESIPNHYSVISESSLSPNNFTLNLVKNYSTFALTASRTGFGPKTLSKVNIQQFTPIDSNVVFKDLIKNIPKQISFLDSLIGDYPYNSFNVVVVKNDNYLDLYNGRKVTLIPYKHSLDSTGIESKLLNSLANQWFGNDIGVKNEYDKWITDGLSRYLEWLWLEKKYGEQKFNKMISSKLVESKKYMGLIDWRHINPFPMYEYDLHYAVCEFGQDSKEKQISGDDLLFLYQVISLDTTIVSYEIKKSFEKRFGGNIADSHNNQYSYYELMQWAKKQKPGSFKMSIDGFFTLKSLMYDEFTTFKFKLAEAITKPDNMLKKEIIKNRSALFIHYLRLYYGDKLFFKKLKIFVKKYSGGYIGTQEATNMLVRDSNGELTEILKLWLYRDDILPSFYFERKKE